MMSNHFVKGNDVESSSKDNDSNEPVKSNSRGLLTEFVFRIFLWNLPLTVTVSENEQKKIDQEFGKTSSENLQKLRTVIVWRFALMVSTIPLGLVVLGLKIANTIEIFDYYSYVEYYHGFNFNILTGLGSISLISNEVISEVTILVGLVVALFYRFNLQRSSQIIRLSFVLLLLIKLWPSIVQSDARLNLDSMLKAANASNIQSTLFVAQFRFQGTLKNSLEFIPLIIAFPRGATGAAMAMLSLAPAAVTPRILLLFFFPFATLLLVLGTSSLVQLAGDAFFAISLVCFYVSDLLMYLLFNAVMAGNVEELSGGKKSKARLYTRILGIILFVAWIITKLVPCANPNNSNDTHCVALKLLSITPEKVVNIIFSFFRNLFLTKLIFADFIIASMVGCEPEVSGLEDIYKKDGDRNNES